MKRKNLIVSVLAIFALYSCQTTKPAQEKVVEQTKEAFRIGTLDKAGLNSIVVQAIVDSIKSGFYPNRHSLLIYKNGGLVLEEYFAGQDYRWGEDLGFVNYNKDKLHDVRSISKSVVSACVGIAISNGLIKNVNQNVFQFFEDYNQFSSPEKETITIHHLLSMTSGLEWNENLPYTDPNNSESLMDASGDAIGFVLSRELINKPGEVWEYSGGSTELLAQVIKRVSGKNIHEFAKENLFKLLDISQSEWVGLEGADPAAASGLRLTPRDMLKFGLLMYQKGKWQENQILSEEWVKQTFASHTPKLEFGSYGYQFWLFEYEMDSEMIQIPAAVGNGDQRIYFDRANDMIVVTTAGNYNQWDIENNAGSILEKIQKEGLTF